MLLEKAWAKVNGNYENSITGFVSEAFLALTGAPVVFFKHAFIKEIWDEIFEANSLKYVICTSSGEADTESTNYSNVGLISKHAYAVIEAFKIQVGDTEECLLKLRNPWGHNEWSGKWSDDWNGWTDDLKEKAGWESKNDGIFLMWVEDYLNYFKTTVVWKIHKDFSLNSIKWSHNRGDYTLVSVNIKKKGMVFFTVSQLNQRWVRRNHDYCLSFLRMFLVKSRQGEPDSDKFPLEYIQGKWWKYEDTTIEFECEPGEYFVYIEVHWEDQNNFNNIVFRTYSEDVPDLTEVDKAEYPNFIKDTLKSWAKMNSELKNYTETGKI